MVDQCILCGEQGIDRIFRKGGISYHRCSACDFTFSQPGANPNLENRLEDYEPAYLDYLRETPEDERNFDALVAWISSFRSLDGARLLDVGAGSGKFVRYLRRRSIAAFGIEPATALYEAMLAAEECFFQRTIEEFAADSQPERFDVVTALDVIEHVERPDRFLKSASRLLAPGGLLFLSTPDISSVLARISGKRWHYFNKYHLSYLSRVSITSLAARYQLRPLGFSRRGRLRSLGYVLRYFGDFVLGVRARRVPEWLDAIFFPINLRDVMDFCFAKETLPGPASDGLDRTARTSPTGQG